MVHPHVTGVPGVGWAHPPLPAEGLARMARVMGRWITQEGAVEVLLPWTAPDKYVDSTRPPNRRRIATAQGQLVGSGEQAFCWLAGTGRLPAAPLMIGWSPCFRDEPVFDEHHHWGFLKAELFARVSPDGPEEDQLRALLARARGVLQPESVRLLKEEMQADGSWDLTLAGVEVGSYGIRQVPGTSHRYVYGTAIAEPRFGQALEKSLAGLKGAPVWW